MNKDQLIGTITEVAIYLDQNDMCDLIKNIMEYIDYDGFSILANNVQTLINEKEEEKKYLMSSLVNTILGVISHHF